MPEALATEDGATLELAASEAAFTRAMNEPEPDEPQHAAPPIRQQLSDEELGAKYGWTTDKDGNRRPKRAKGRPRLEARVTTAAPAAAAASARPAKADQPADYTGPLTELTSALWMVAAAIPIPAEQLRIKVRAQAYVLRENQPGLVGGLNLMAQHNSIIRKGVEALSKGNAGWVLPATMALAPFAVQTAQLWRMDPGQLAEVAAATDQQWAAEFEAMRQQFAQAEAAPAEASAAAAA